MSENEVEKTQETGEKPVEGEQQTPVKPEPKKPKAAKAAVSEQQAPARKKMTLSTLPGKATAIEEMMAAIKKMTVLELAELVKALETEFGVSAAAPVVTAAPATGAAAAPAAEEKTEFNVILKDIGANKISVIRAVREVTALGLKESKDLVESAPKAVKEGVSKDEAATIKQKLEAAGATAEIT